MVLCRSSDDRVAFFKGWFSETLPDYVPPPHKQLFVNLDADLYSSTKTVLEFLKPHIVRELFYISTNFKAGITSRKRFVNCYPRPDGNSKSLQLRGLVLHAV
jgi:hypothetical protein